MKMKSLGRILVVAVTALGIVGCAELPGDRKTQGAVIGGAAGATAGGVLAKNNRGLGALLGGILGAAGGYVIAAKTDKIDKGDTDSAAAAARKAQENPATAADAQKAITADLNYDGFVTLDEVVAMKEAGFSEDKMIERLEATKQVFELNAEHQKYLTDRGVSARVIERMNAMNRATTQDQNQNRRTDVIGTPTPTVTP